MSIDQQSFIEQAKRNYVAPIALDEHNVIIESQEQYTTIDFAKLSRMCFSTKYAGEIPPLPRKMELEHLAFTCGIRAERFNQLDLQHVKSVYASISALDATKIIVASQSLEELQLSFHDEESKVEIALINVPNLKRLVIRGKNTYQLNCSIPITSLEELTIDRCFFSDYEWIGSLCNLKALNLWYVQIDDFDRMKLPATLTNLDISSSELNKITDLSKFKNLGYLNLFLSKGDITTHFEEIKKLNIKRLIITELDRYRDYFRNGIDTNHSIFSLNNAIYRAYQYVEGYRNNPEQYHPYIRKKYEGQTDDDIFAGVFLHYLKQYTDSAFYACTPKAFRYETYSVEIKKWLLSKFEDLYPFLDFSDYYRQIATEEKGFLDCVKDVKSDSFSFVNYSGLYRVCFRPKDGKGLSIRSLSMHDFIDKKRSHTRLRLNEEVIKKAAQKYVPDYDWNSQCLEIVILDYFGNIESKKLEIAVLIAIALYQYDLHISNDVIFAGELNNKAEISRWEFFADEFIIDGEISKMILFTTQKKHPMKYGSVEVEKYADLQTFVKSTPHE